MVPDRIDLEQLKREAHRAAAGRIRKARLVLLPITSGGALLLSFADGASWRRVSLFILIPLLSVWAYFEDRRARRLEAQGTVPAKNVLMGLVTNAGLACLTGGIRSAFVAVLVMMAFTQAFFMPATQAARLILGEIAFIAVLTLFQGANLFGAGDLLQFGGEAQGNEFATFARGAFVILFMISGWVIASRLRAPYEGMLRRALRARDDALQGYAEETRAVTAIAGTIAHELKNPLSSVKALSDLVARKVTGREAEHLAVVHQEVERMQEILAQFLNFSRPVTPLVARETGVQELCTEVATLHEGVADERDVRIRVAVSSGVKAHCDARKVKQILVNLVQNALAVSPRGSEIRLEARVPDGSATGLGWVRITVSDEGPGLPDGFEDKLFQPGVTTKIDGSGFGLVVSRALARQHGGDLALRNQDRGCVAELSLPACEVTYATAPRAVA
jgi:signal transduction histidine kinase